MNITIKMGRAVFALHLDPADLRAIVLAATLVLHPASRPALEDLQQAVMRASAWFSTSAVADSRVPSRLAQ